MLDKRVTSAYFIDSAHKVGVADALGGVEHVEDLLDLFLLEDDVVAPQEAPQLVRVYVPLLVRVEAREG